MQMSGHREGKEKVVMRQQMRHQMYMCIDVYASR